jgi:hypothetical protein
MYPSCSRHPEYVRSCSFCFAQGGNVPNAAQRAVIANEAATRVLDAWQRHGTSRRWTMSDSASREVSDGAAALIRENPDWAQLLKALSKIGRAWHMIGSGCCCAEGSAIDPPVWTEDCPSTARIAAASAILAEHPECGE